MPPAKTSKSEPRRRSLRIQKKEIEKQNDEKKRTNLKDLLSKNSQRSKRKSGIETDGGFTFKRTASQLEETASSSSSQVSSNKSNGSKSKRLNSQSSRLKTIRKLTEADVTITPELKRTHDYEEHSTSVQVALPISDTPIIRRNKELRNGNGIRRSSLINRGKRVSSIGNGFQATPHKKVPTADFYKHLDSDLPDPHKMRQLLSWCSQRIFDEEKDGHIKKKNKLPNEELTALNIAKVIKEELVRDLVNGKIGLSWWNRDDDGQSTDDAKKEEKTLLPNAKNIKNTEVLNDLTKRLKELETSISNWEADNLHKQIELPNNDNLSLNKIPTTLPINDENSQMLTNDSVIQEISEIEDSTYNEITNNLELTIDEFNDNVFKLESSSKIMNKFISLKSIKLSEILDSTFNDDSLTKITQLEMNKDLSTDQLLKGISRLDR